MLRLADLDSCFPSLWGLLRFFGMFPGWLQPGLREVFGSVRPISPSQETTLSQRPSTQYTAGTITLLMNLPSISKDLTLLC